MTDPPGDRPEPARRRALGRSCRDEGLDALLVLHPPDVRYLSGFTGTSGWLLLGGEGSWLLTDHRYASQAAAELRDVELLEPTRDRPAGLESAARDLGWKRIGFDPDRTTVALLERLQEAAPGLSWPACEGWIARLRRRKSPAEVEAVRRSLRIAEASLVKAAGRLEPGWSERRLAAELERECRVAGADGMAFDTLVAAGPRSALPHGVAGDREIRAGEPLLVDLGCRVDGYCSDITRMIWPGGKVGEPWSELHRILVAAQEAGLAALGAGVAGREVDRAARELIEEAGYGDAFGHGLGHGVGLEVHEEPALSPRSDDVLESGMIVTVEPGIYLEGRGGVRVEDMAVVADDGHVRLTVQPPEPILS